MPVSGPFVQAGSLASVSTTATQEKPMAHDHTGHVHLDPASGDRRVAIAIWANAVLTIVQIIEGKGDVFAPLTMGGARWIRASGPPATRLRRWLDRMETAIFTAMFHLDDNQTWNVRAETVMMPLSRKHRRPCARCCKNCRWYLPPSQRHSRDKVEPPFSAT